MIGADSVQLRQEVSSGQQMKEDEVGETCYVGWGPREVTLDIGGDLNICRFV